MAKTILLERIKDTLGQVNVVDVEGKPEWIPAFVGPYESEEEAIAAIKKTIMKDGKSAETAQNIIDGMGWDFV